MIIRQTQRAFIVCCLILYVNGQNALKDCSKDDPNCEFSDKICIERFVSRVASPSSIGYQDALRLDDDLIQGRTNFKCYDPIDGENILRQSDVEDPTTGVTSLYIKIEHNYVIVDGVKEFIQKREDLDQRCIEANYTFTERFTCKTYLYYVKQTQDLENRLFEYWIIIASVYIILMQLGFILLETGQVRKRNQMNIISKNFCDICVATIAFYLCGYAFSTEANGGVIGHGKFLTLDFTNANYLDWFYKYSLCSASTTIVSGSLAERTFVDTYIVFAVLMTTVIYPIASSWVLGGGWLHELGFHDAAGAGYIHMLGGLAGLVGTALLGPRSGIFDKTTVNKLVKQANQKKKLMSKKYLTKKNLKDIKQSQQYESLYRSKLSNSTTMSSAIGDQLKSINIENRQGVREGKDLKTFYNFDEDTPMKFRIYLFRQQFKEFSTLKQDQCIKLIQLYDKNLNKSHELNSSQFAIIGSLFLYVGWLMLNASSVFQIKYKQGLGNDYFASHIESPQHAVMVSILSSSVSAFVTYLLFNKFRKEESNQNLSLTVMNSSLAGLVMITGVCDDVHVYNAMIIGFLAGLCYLTATQVLEKYRIDDPVEAVQIHGICGFFGVLNVGVFGKKYGVMTQSNRSLNQLGIQLLGAIVLAIWSIATSYMYFKVVQSLGRLRVNKFYEIVGIDIVMHTMSDQIGDNDDFDRDSRTQQYQNEMIKYRVKKKSTNGQDSTIDDIAAADEDSNIHNMYLKASGMMFENPAELAYTSQAIENEMKFLKEEMNQQQEAEAQVVDEHNNEDTSTNNQGFNFRNSTRQDSPYVTKKSAMTKIQMSAI